MTKIVVLNGSPKGDESVTLHYCHYMAKFMVDTDLEVINIGKYIKKLTKNGEYLRETAKKIQQADGIIWAFPVYTFTVPYQMMRFIELITDAGLGDVFQGKYATSMSTSMHFFDHTAHHYIHAISEDLGIQYVPGHSAETDDLFKADQQRNIKNFTLHFLRTVKEKRMVLPKYLPVVHETNIYAPGHLSGGSFKKRDKKVVIITDTAEEDSSLSNMVKALVHFLPYGVDIINLNDLALKGGCLGCIKCVFHKKCIYKDGFSDLHQEKIVNADLVISACTIKKRYVLPIWKMYTDRQFYNGHRVTRKGKYVAYLFSGPLRQMPELRGLFESMSEVSGEYLIDMITDEQKDSEALTAVLKQFAENIHWALENGIEKTPNFLGIGGMKVFRDLIYTMKGFMKEDHRFYKKHKLYDYPQKQIGKRIGMYFLGFLMNFKFIRDEAAKTAASSTLKRYQKIIAEAE